MYPNPNFKTREHSGHQLKVIGVGEIKASPDLVIVPIGIVTQSEEAISAQEENAKITARVLQSLYAMSISKDEIETVHYQVRPLYEYPEGKPPEIKGYEVSHLLHVETTKLNDIGKMIETTSASGATRIGNPKYELTNSLKYEQEAYRLAIQEATWKAKTIANGFGASILLPPQKIEDQGSNRRVDRNTLQASEPIILPKELIIRVQLLVQFAYS